MELCGPGIVGIQYLSIMFTPALTLKYTEVPADSFEGDPAAEASGGSPMIEPRRHSCCRGGPWKGPTEILRLLPALLA